MHCKYKSIVRSMWKGDCNYNITSVFKDKDGDMLTIKINIGDLSIKLLNI